MTTYIKAPLTVNELGHPLKPDDQDVLLILRNVFVMNYINLGPNLKSIDDYQIFRDSPDSSTPCYTNSFWDVHYVF